MRHVLTWFYGWAGRVYGWFHDDAPEPSVPVANSLQDD